MFVHYCYSRRAVLGTEQKKFHKRHCAHSEQTWGGRQLDVDILYRMYQAPNRKVPEAHSSPVSPQTCLCTQCAAVTTQCGASTQPPHVCREPRATLACQGQRPGATGCPPTIREARGLAPHSANREALVRWKGRQLGVRTV